MHYIKKYINYIKENINSDDWHEYVDSYIDDNMSYMFNWQRVSDDMHDYIDREFPYGLTNIPDKPILYRILTLKEDDVKLINTEKLGIHFVGDKKIFNKDFLQSIGIDSGEHFYVVTIQTTISNIDIQATLDAKAQYNDEEEYTLKNDFNLKIINTEKWDF